MKTTQYNFQVRSLDNHRDWERIEPMCRNCQNWTMALLFARKLSRDFKAEVRVTEGTTPFTTNGTYIREIDS
ncbi:hypothetical protein AS589_07850 [Empedobacter brevis]|nr:hypothetical protein AS589_07850 [Empedobacter brevis]